MITRQQELFGLIARSVDNLQKLGSANITRGSVQSRMNTLKTYWDKFISHHDALVKARTQEQAKLPYFADDLYSQCEDQYHNSLGYMLDLLDSLTLHATTVPATAKTDNGSTSTGSQSRRLPRIDLPKFSGDYAQWTHFRDLFQSTILDNADLSAVEKLHYLKMSMTGEPAQLLKSMTISGDNLARAWELLVGCYENKRILIDAQLTALFATRKIKTKCAADVKRLLGDVKETLGALESVGCSVQHWDPLTVFMTASKLDPESLKEWEKTRR